MAEIVMPQLGESVVEGTLTRWLVKEGDRVLRDQPIAEVSTDKADTDLPSPVEGIVAELIVAEGDVVAVGRPLARIEGEDKGKPSGRPSPLVRRLARELHVDPASVEGTGSHGRVTKEDIIRAGGPAPEAATSESPTERPIARPPAVTERAPRRSATQPPPTQPPAQPSSTQPPPMQPSVTQTSPTQRSPTQTPPTDRWRYRPTESDRVVPMSSRRRSIADHMVYSKRVAPHVTTVAEVDLHRVARLRRRAVDSGSDAPSWLAFVADATLRALTEHPEMNAAVVDGSIVHRGAIHLGIAVETNEGLVVPVVRDADRLSLRGLTRAIAELAERARVRKLLPAEVEGASFTLSNPGRHGNLFGTPILNQPQVGILRLGEVAKRAVVVDLDGDEALAIHPILYLALAYDHRAVDGAPANEFLHRIREILERGEFEL